MDTGFEGLDIEGKRESIRGQQISESACSGYKRPENRELTCLLRLTVKRYMFQLLLRIKTVSSSGMTKIFIKET